MIRGQVNADREAVIPIRVRSPGGLFFDGEAVIDTGFTGYLSLPPAQITLLGLPHVETRTYTLGDGSAAAFDIYLATIEWDGRDRDVLVLAPDGASLVGRAMLYGFRLFVDVADGGDVTVESRP